MLVCVARTRSLLVSRTTLVVSTYIYQLLYQFSGSEMLFLGMRRLLSNLRCCLETSLCKHNPCAPCLECQTQMCALLRLRPRSRRQCRRLILSARHTNPTRHESPLSAIPPSQSDQDSGDGSQPGFSSSGENSFGELLKLPATFCRSVGADKKCSAPMPKALLRLQQQKIGQVFSIFWLTDHRDSHRGLVAYVFTQFMICPAC